MQMTMQDVLALVGAKELELAGLRQDVAKLQEELQELKNKQDGEKKDDSVPSQ